jgi:benzodiazapine receptor
MRSSYGTSAWYQTLKKSPLTPPGWIISSVWAVLYTMIIVSGVIFLKNGGTIYSKGFVYYCTAWVFNLLWPPLFFTYRRLGLSVIVILGLNVLIACTINEFYKFSHTAAYLLVPYMVWVVFATYLSSYIFRYNK